MTIKEVTMRELQRKIIETLGVKPEINPTDEIEQRALFLANHLASEGLKGFALGISGGQDSLLAGLLAKRAVELRRAEGAEATFHAMLLPYKTQADREDALLAIETIQPDEVHPFNIHHTVDGFVADYTASMGEEIPDFIKGNAKARARMMAQYAIASKFGLEVIGTDHAAEAVMGFFTKFGDGAADILPLSGLIKRHGRSLLREL